MPLKYEHLLGRPFVHGSQDCYGLIRDFYRDNFGLTLTNYARPTDWWWNGLDLYRKYFAAEGFRSIDVPLNEVRPADLFLVALDAEIPNHAAIYLGDGKILHHRYGKLSQVHPYSGAMRNRTTGIIRHKDVPDLRPPLEPFDIMQRLLPHKRRKLEAALEAARTD